MIEPWSTLFAGYEDHWVFGKYLTEDEPDWGGLLADDRIPALSSGEKVLLDIACWFAGPWYQLDVGHRHRVAVAALLLTNEARAR